MINDQADSTKQAGLALSDMLPVYGGLAAAAFRSDDIAVFRVWLILHHVFNRTAKRQVISDGEIVDLISQLGLFTDRHWRNIRQRGQGRYWDCIDEGLFIYGSRAVSISLNSGFHAPDSTVQVNLGSLTGKYTAARRTLYAVTHKQHSEAPISRAALSGITGLSRSSQWRLERKNSRLGVAPNYEIISRYRNIDDLRDAAFIYGSSVYRHVDKRGFHGKAGAAYVARRLPNSYTTTFAPVQGNSSRRRLNKQLATHVNCCDMPIATERYQTIYAVPQQKTNKLEGSIAPTSCRGIWYRLGGC